MGRGLGIGQRISAAYDASSTPLRPYQFQVYIPSQIPLFSDGDEHCPKKVVGDTGEYIVRALAGGKLTNHIYIENPNSRFDLHTKPDLITPAEDTEVKTGNIKNNIMLTDLQVARARLRQAEYSGQESHPAKRFTLAMLRHRVDGVMSYAGREQELIEQLAQNIACLVNVDLSVELALHAYKNPCKKEALVYRFEPRDFRQHHKGQTDGREYKEPYTGIMPRTLEALLVKPEPVLEKLGLDPTEYSIERQRSHPRFKVQGQKVKEFPITRILHKDYARWRSAWLASYDRVADLALLSAGEHDRWVEAPSEPYGEQLEREAIQQESDEEQPLRGSMPDDEVPF